MPARKGKGPPDKASNRFGVGEEGEPPVVPEWEPPLEELFPLDTHDGITANLLHLLQRFNDGKCGSEEGDFVRKVLADARANIESRHRVAPKGSNPAVQPAPAVVAAGGGTVSDGPWGVARAGRG